MAHNSLVKVWVTAPGKEACQAEVLAEDRKNTEWIVGEKYLQISAVTT